MTATPPFARKWVRDFQPRPCASCGEEFTPEAYQAKRCPSCRATADVTPQCALDGCTRPRAAHRRLYCSQACQDEGARRYFSARLRSKGMTCGTCGVAIVDRAKTGLCKSCSWRQVVVPTGHTPTARAAGIANRRENRHPVTCQVCGTTVMRETTRAKYCSNACNVKAARTRAWLASRTG